MRDSEVLSVQVDFWSKSKIFFLLCYSDVLYKHEGYKR